MLLVFSTNSGGKKNVSPIPQYSIYKAFFALQYTMEHHFVSVIFEIKLIQFTSP